MKMNKRMSTQQLSDYPNPFFLKEQEKEIFFGVPFDQNFLNEPYPEIITYENHENDINQLIQPSITKKSTTSEDLSNQNSFFQKIVIGDRGIKAKIKNIWDFFMIALIIYISAVTSYRVAFGVEKNQLDEYQIIIDTFAETCFGMDIFLSFITGYLDSETGKFITNGKKIAKRYLKSWFIIDMLSIFPWEEMNRLDLQLLKLLRMLRLIRMARLFKLLNEEMVNTLVLRLMSNLSMENKINISYIMKYMFKIFRLLLLGIGITYIIACLWYIFIYNMEEDHKPSFYKLINVPENSNFRKYKKLIFIYFFRFVICCYFILTTLATVGYGDYVPQNDNEKIIAIFLMIIGITFFSYVLNSFTEIVTTYDQKMGKINKSTDLQVWLNMLQKFSKHPLPKDTIETIYNHIGHYWKNDRLAGIMKDDKFFFLMPDDLKKEFLYTIFQDIFFQKFKPFFLNRGLEYNDLNFYIEMSFNLIPRKYDADEKIISAGENFQEVFFIMEGEVYVTLEYEGVQVNRYFNEGYYVGDFNILFEKPALFSITANSETKMYTISKEKLLSILSTNEQVEQQMKINSFKTYKESMKVLIKEIQGKIFMKNKKIITEREIHQIFREKLISTVDKPEKTLKTSFTETSTISLIEKFKKMYEIFENLKEELDSIDNDISELCNYQKQ